MKRWTLLRTAGAAGLAAVLCSCVIIPTISETHLLSDVREKHLSVTVGTELLIDQASSVLPDPAFGSVSYAPTDWFEFGLAALGHTRRGSAVSHLRERAYRPRRRGAQLSREQAPAAVRGGGDQHVLPCSGLPRWSRRLAVSVAPSLHFDLDREGSRP